jgi:hypothetical protein
LHSNILLALHLLEHQPLCTRSSQLWALEMVLALSSVLELVMQRESVSGLVSGLVLELVEELHV